MKALVKFSKGREGVALREVPLPEPSTGEVRIQILAAGICGSDLHAMFDQRKTALPVILGHEFVGTVEKTCGDVGDLKVGDCVVGIPACYGCGECKWCKEGIVTLCPERKSIGTHKDGAFAPYMVMPAKYCFKVPQDANNILSYAAIEPLACAVRGVYEHIEVQEGDVAVVSGPGTLGLFAIQCLKARGAYVIASGLPHDRHRLKIALECGADEAVESVEALRAAIARKNPDGADIAVEATGVVPSLETCLDVLRNLGTFLQIGVYGGPITFDFNAVYRKELKVRSTNSTALSTWALTMDLLKRGLLDLTPVISLQLPLAEWEKGFDAAIDKSAFKVLLIP